MMERTNSFRWSRCELRSLTTKFQIMAWWQARKRCQFTTTTKFLHIQLTFMASCQHWPTPLTCSRNKWFNLYHTVKSSLKSESTTDPDVRSRINLNHQAHLFLKPGPTSQISIWCSCPREIEKRVIYKENVPKARWVSCFKHAVLAKHLAERSRITNPSLMLKYSILFFFWPCKHVNI